MGVFGDMVRKAQEAQAEPEVPEPTAAELAERCKLLDPRTVTIPEGRNYWIYIAVACDSWHVLPDYDPHTMYHHDPGDFNLDLARAQRVALKYVPGYENWQSAGRPKLYILPELCSPQGLMVWAVSFHKGDALLVSTVPLPWIANPEYIEWWRHCT